MGFFKLLFGRSSVPPDRDQFARIVSEAIRRAGESRPLTYDKAAFRLVCVENGKESRVVNLANLHLEYNAAEAAEREKWLQRTCKALVRHMDLPEEFEDVKPDLLPTIRPRSMVEEMLLKSKLDGGKLAEMAWLPLTDHLVICFVYDLPNSMQFIMADQWDTWGITPYEALEIAVQNLEEREFSVIGLGEKLYIIETGDSYDATRMLLKEMLRKLKFVGQPVAMPVSRNTLMIAGSEDAEGIGIMVDLTEKKMGEARPLCPIPVILKGDEWETWTPPHDHPHLEKLRQFKLQHLGGECAEQKEALVKLHERDGTDVFVATFSAVEKNGIRRSYSTWSKGVTTWLPETDYVALFDPETKKPQLAPWGGMMETVGHLLTPQDCYPPRWLVSDFPTPEQIEGMCVEDMS